MMFTVYADKEVFENIVVFNEQTPRWYNILCNHADVCLNMTDDELAAEEVEGTPVFEYIKANGARSPIPLKEYFEAISEDPSIMAEKPRAAFLLDVDVATAKGWQEAYGIIVQSRDEIDDSFLAHHYKRKLTKGEQVGGAGISGWKSLLPFALPPSNSLVISDNFLLTSTESVNSKTLPTGPQNLLWLLDAILPEKLAITYHITIISEDKDRQEPWRNHTTCQLIAAIKALRTFQINMEVVFVKSEDFHERLLLMNYVNASAEHGFSAFRYRDGNTVIMANRFFFNAYFNVLQSLGESEVLSATKDLALIKKVCNGLAEHIHSGKASYLGAILGGCRANKTLSNRLINDA